MAVRKKDFAQIHSAFDAPVSARFDCGRFCAPLNDGTPVCCSTDHAIPVVHKTEWKHLKERTDLWSKFKPQDKDAQKIVDDLAPDCTAIQCKGARFCERENRTLACRAFPFFPYFPKGGDIAGLTTYWIFEDRCWVISNQWCVDQEFITQLIDAYRLVFSKDKDEEEAYRDESAKARKVFARRKQALPILGLDGGLLKVEPKTKGRIVPASPDDFPAYGPYTSQKTYRDTVHQLNDEQEPAALPRPAWGKRSPAAPKHKKPRAA